MRALAITSTTRLPSLPDLPTVAESGYPGFGSGFWFGLSVPSKTPRQTISTLHEATVASLKKPDVVKRLATIVFTPVGDSPEEFAAYIRSEIEKWGAIVKATGLTAN